MACVETFTLFSESLDDWLQTRRGELYGAVNAVSLEPCADLAAAARTIADRFVISPPQLIPGPDGFTVEPFDAARLPPGVPAVRPGSPIPGIRFDQDPERRVRVRLRVTGDASLLRLKPGVQAGRLPDGTVEGQTVVKVLPWPLPPQAVEQYRDVVGRLVGRLNHELNMFWGAGLVGQAHQWLQDRLEAAKREADWKAQAAEKLRHLGYQVVCE